MTEVRQPSDFGRQMDELFQKFTTDAANSRSELPTENDSKAINAEATGLRLGILDEAGSEPSSRIDTDSYNGREPPVDFTAHNVRQNAADRVLQEWGPMRQALTDATKEIEETKAKIVDVDRAYLYQHAELEEFRRDRKVVDRMLQELEITQQALTDVTKEVEETTAKVSAIDRASFQKDAELEELRRELADARSYALNYSSPSPRSPNQAPETSGVTFSIGRTAIVITFIMAALFMLVDPDAIATIIASKLSLLPSPVVHVTAWIESRLGVPIAKALVMAGASLEIAAAVFIAMGMFIRPASIVLLIFTAVWICWGSQWDFQNGIRADQIISALNGLSIMGGLLVLCNRIGVAEAVTPLADRTIYHN